MWCGAPISTIFSRILLREETLFSHYSDFRCTSLSCQQIRQPSAPEASYWSCLIFTATFSDVLAHLKISLPPSFFGVLESFLPSIPVSFTILSRHNAVHSFRLFDSAVWRQKSFGCFATHSSGQNMCWLKHKYQHLGLMMTCAVFLSEWGGNLQWEKLIAGRRHCPFFSSLRCPNRGRNKT